MIAGPLCGLLLIAAALIFICVVLYRSEKATPHQEADKQDLKAIEVEKKAALENSIQDITKEWPDWQKKAIVLALRIADFIENEEIRQEFLDLLEIYICHKKIAVFSSLAITNVEIVFYKRYYGTGIYQSASCPIMTEGLPWKEIIDIRMVADAPSSKVTPHENHITTSNGGVMYGNMIIPYTSNNTITTYSTETKYHTSGTILIYTKKGYTSLHVEDVATIYQSLMVYWEAYKKAPPQNDEKLSYFCTSHLSEFNAAYSSFEKEQKKYAPIKQSANFQF